MGLRKDVSKIEFIVYVAVWSSAVLYSIYCFAKSANKRFEHYDGYGDNIEDVYRDFDQGWSLVSRKKDLGDTEWRAIKHLLKTLPFWIVSSTIISEIIRYFHFIQLLPLWQILIAVAFITKELGIHALGLILWQPLLFILVLSITHNKTIIWITNISAFMLIIVLKYACLTDECFDLFRLNLVTMYVTLVSICWMNLRCLSGSMYIADSKQNRANIKFLAFCLYLPNVISGPIISSEDFQECYQFSGNLGRRILELFINVVRLLFWFVFTEFLLHFVYVNAIWYHPEWIRSFDLTSLYGYGYFMGQFFHLKYLIFYGLPITFAKFDNVRVPTLPVCIGRIHLYSDMWKYFDAGLHNFLLRYIYVPLLKSSLIKSRLLASFICFIFIYVWHGVESYILLWSILNYLGLVLEHTSVWINENYLQKTNTFKNIEQKWFRRIKCLAASPLLGMSCISNFYFFAGAEIGNIFVSRTLNAGILSNVILLAILYTCCQVSTEAKFHLHKTSRKQKIS